MKKCKTTKNHSLRKIGSWLIDTNKNDTYFQTFSLWIQYSNIATFILLVIKWIQILKALMRVLILLEVFSHGLKINRAIICQFLTLINSQMGRSKYTKRKYKHLFYFVCMLRFLESTVNFSTYRCIDKNWLCQTRTSIVSMMVWNDFAMSSF